MRGAGVDEEQAFLEAIAAASSDMSARLVYADWLDERGDARAEYVRLLAEICLLPCDDPARPSLLRRHHEMRAAAAPYWAARLDPPVWCAVGDVVDSRPAGQERLRPRAIRLFRENAKILLAKRSDLHAIRNPQRFGWKPVEVVGRHRKSREWTCRWIRMRNACRWRARLVHDPAAKILLREAGWPGFLLHPTEFMCPAEQRDSRNALRRLFGAMGAASKRESSAS